MKYLMFVIVFFISFGHTINGSEKISPVDVENYLPMEFIEDSLIETFSQQVILNSAFESSTSCDDRAYNVMHQAFNAGYSDDEVFWFMNVAYALCKGYSMSDINL